MKTERLIHASIFILILVGLAVLSAWASYTYIDAQINLLLVIASIPLFWGLILLALYLGFNQLGWKWWT
jgi:ABC-type dipeptide/oligopeptide/nickel transport system permease component